MGKLLKAVQRAASHRKACQTCTDWYVCDEMAEINLTMVKAAFSQ